MTDDIDRLIQETPDFIVLDYPFGHRHSLIGSYLNCSVFIDTQFDIALARRITRDYDRVIMVSSWTGKASLFDDMEYYLKNGRHLYLHAIDESRKDADLIIDGSLAIDKIVDIICGKIITMQGVSCKANNAS